jgi:hypothetical protein
MNGTGAALRDPATEFRAGEPDGIAQCPEQRGIGFQIDVVLRSIDRERDHFGSFSVEAGPYGSLRPEAGQGRPSY